MSETNQCALRKKNRAGSRRVESKPISPQREALTGALPIVKRVGISVAIRSAQKNVCSQVDGTGKTGLKKTGGKKLTRRHGRGSHQVSAGARRGLIKYVRKTVEWRTGVTAIQNRTTKRASTSPFFLFDFLS
ncbi:hypothetical protein [Paraburkholderia sp. BR14320]|uniref:hypothetical protein n=1 Tax=unclassified Paraburkholderia TaxID=2615204 RepID=UPI0034CE1B3C